MNKKNKEIITTNNISETDSNNNSCFWDKSKIIIKNNEKEDIKELYNFSSTNNFLNMIFELETKNNLRKDN